MATTDRTARLLALCRSRGLDGFLVSSLPNVRYLSGFTGSFALCLLAGRTRILFTDFRYRLQARREARGFTVRVVTGGGLAGAVGRAVAGKRLERLGFEAESLSYAKHRALRRSLPRSCRFVAAPPLVEEMRAVKDRGEKRLLAKLARMTDGVLAACQKRLRAGMTEREVAGLLDLLAREAGADGLSFPPIVASGSSGAMPHHRAGRRRLKAGRPLLMDFGLTLNGYNSDLTRTFHLGRVARRYREIYGAVVRAQQIAIQAIKPGVTAGFVDGVARGSIAAAGYSGLFGHGLGHGIGLEVHEAPRLGAGSAATLEEGMVFTVEPGIYVPGWGGVRVEDMVLVTKKGCRLLTGSGKEIGDSVL